MKMFAQANAFPATDYRLLATDGLLAFVFTWR